MPYRGRELDSDYANFYAGLSDQFTRSFDLFRNETTKDTIVDRANVLTTVTTHTPDSTVDDVVVSLNGRQVRHQTTRNLTYNSKYDGLGRLVKTTDPRTDTSATARISYFTSGTGAIGQVASRQDTAGNQTNYTTSPRRAGWPRRPILSTLIPYLKPEPPKRIPERPLPR